MLLADLLVEASSRMQLIITTHSDALVSALTDDAGSVLVCDHRGGTVLERVDPGTLTNWLEEYRLGDLWRIGKLGGNP
jgi:predicted ATPase